MLLQYHKSFVQLLVSHFPKFIIFMYFVWQKDSEYLSGHDHEVFHRRIASPFNNFAESTEKSCREKLTTTCPHLLQVCFHMANEPFNE